MPSWSTIKVLLALAFWRAVAGERLSAAYPYALQPWQSVGGSAALPGFRHAVRITLADLAHLSLDRSRLESADRCAPGAAARPLSCRGARRALHRRLGPCGQAGRPRVATEGPARAVPRRGGRRRGARPAHQLVSRARGGRELPAEAAAGMGPDTCPGGVGQSRRTSRDRVGNCLTLLGGELTCRSPRTQERLGAPPSGESSAKRGCGPIASAVLTPCLPILPVAPGRWRSPQTKSGRGTAASGYPRPDNVWLSEMGGILGELKARPPLSERRSAWRIAFA